MKKILILSLMLLGIFGTSTFAYNFADVHKKVESYLELKAKKNPTYAKYYQKIEQKLGTYVDAIKAGDKVALKNYVSAALVTKLISNIENGKFKRLKARNLVEKKVLQSAFDQGNYVTVGLKTTLSKTDLEAKLSKYLPKFQIVSFDNGTYLIKLPKDSPFAQIFLEQVQDGYIPELDFLSSSVVEPKVLKKVGEASLWNMMKIEADQIQSNLTDSKKSVIIAVLDTGIDPNHQDLKNTIWYNTKEIAGNGIDDDSNGYVDDTWGWDFGDNDNDPAPGDAHGTHVAGTIAAQVNGVGVYGANSAAKLMAVKIFVGNDGYTDSYRFSEGVKYAVDNGALVINSSLGGEGTDDFEQSALDYAKSHNVIVVVAAGNENKDASNTYPCADVDTICVGATDQNDNRAYFSNYGSKVDIAAPGVSILSTIPNNQYAYYDGTSMATPHVTAVVGIIKMFRPTATLDEVKDILKKDGLPGPSDLGGVIIDAKKVYEDVAGVSDDSDENQVIDDVLDDSNDDNQETEPVNDSTDDQNEVTQPSEDEEQTNDDNTDQETDEGNTSTDEGNTSTDEDADTSDDTNTDEGNIQDTTPPVVSGKGFYSLYQKKGVISVRTYDKETGLSKIEIYVDGILTTSKNVNGKMLIARFFLDLSEGAHQVLVRVYNTANLVGEANLNIVVEAISPVVQKPTQPSTRPTTQPIKPHNNSYSTRINRSSVSVGNVRRIKNNIRR